MKSLIVGFGQIGKALYRLLSDKYEVECVDKEEKELPPRYDVDFMHICYPMVNVEGFKRSVVEYVKKYNPWHVIIESTVIPGTTEEISRACERTVTYSPCRGQHDRLYFDLKRYDKYISTFNSPIGDELVYNYYTKCGLKVRIAPRPEILELVKLLDVVSLGVYSAWALHEKQICGKYEIDFNWVREFGRQTEEFYKKRPDIYPPEGGFSGKCVFEDTVLLKKISDSGFLDLIEKIGKKGEGE